MVLEGPTLVADALGRGIPLEALFIEEGIDAPANAPEATFRVRAGVFAGALDVATAPAMAAIVARAALPGPAPGDGPILVLAGVADPGNAGTLIRSAEAAGFTSVRFLAGSVDPFSPKCVRASAGSVLGIHIDVDREVGKLLDGLTSLGYRLIGAGAQRGTPYDRCDLTGRLALVVGSESHGVPDGVAAALDGWVSIPMQGTTESLNAAVAGSVLAFEVARQRREGRPG